MIMGNSRWTLLNRKRYLTVLTIFFGIYATALLGSPLIGPVNIDIVKALTEGPSSSDNVDANILFLARLPRILMASLAGAALSVAGVIFQALLRNELAAPFTLGVTSGAALGAVIHLAISNRGK